MHPVYGQFGERNIRFAEYHIRAWSRGLIKLNNETITRKVF